MLRVNPKFSSQKFFSFILYLYKTMDIHETYCDNHFRMYVTQIITLYTLNLYSAVCQLCLNKTGRKKEKNPIECITQRVNHNETYGL